MVDIPSGPGDFEEAKLKATDLISSSEGMAHRDSFSSGEIEWGMRPERSIWWQGWGCWDVKWFLWKLTKQSLTCWWPESHEPKSSFIKSIAFFLLRIMVERWKYLVLRFDDVYHWILDFWRQCKSSRIMHSLSSHIRLFSVEVLEVEGSKPWTLFIYLCLLCRWRYLILNFNTISKHF